ncbi:GalT protein [[Mannheimia] succiniciproducens MBEL55E]|uniref:GalT protein n=1 Tax=Mannheimia succiniciproducens (strain KCTC 0769BP / MBEL55E) TaxID=221988 RepID=Q65UV7_MANSM|nr:GalT protein [[Mannheimia] succiniciproducens MBEL55E]
MGLSFPAPGKTPLARSAGKKLPRKKNQAMTRIVIFVRVMRVLRASLIPIIKNLMYSEMIFRLYCLKRRRRNKQRIRYFKAAGLRVKAV